MDAPGSKDAAVLVPLYRDPLSTILTERRSDLRRHAGEISFPGGRQDHPEEDLRATALREAHEEIGLDPGSVELVGALPPVGTFVTGYRVFPYLVRITVPEQWQIAEREVAELFDVKLSDLLRAGAHDKMIERFPTWQKAEQVSFYQIGTHRLWGLSYRILHPIIPRLAAGEWAV